MDEVPERNLPRPSPRRKKQLLDSEKTDGDVERALVGSSRRTPPVARVHKPSTSSIEDGPTTPVKVIEIDEKNEVVMKIPNSPRPQSLKKSSLKKKTSLYRKISDGSRHKSRMGSTRQQQHEHIPGFERLKEQKSVKMALDWINFRIWLDTEDQDLFQVSQTKNCSLTVTDSNELFIRKPNAENVMRIHSNVVEDTRNFDFYAGTERYVGTLACDARQTFKVPAKLKNVRTGQTYSITPDRGGQVKSWLIDETLTGLPIARAEVQTGHRWKSLYTLTFIEPSGSGGCCSAQILSLGFLLALASARLESEVVPVFFAVSAFLVTFIIFFIIQFT